MHTDQKFTPDVSCAWRPGNKMDGIGFAEIRIPAICCRGSNFRFVEDNDVFPGEKTNGSRIILVIDQYQRPRLGYTCLCTTDSNSVEGLEKMTVIVDDTDTVDESTGDYSLEFDLSGSGSFAADHTIAVPLLFDERGAIIRAPILEYFEGAGFYQTDMFLIRVTNNTTGIVSCSGLHLYSLRPGIIANLGPH